MEPLSPIDFADRKLVQIVDAATAQAVQNSGAQVVCRPGCHECCLGPFPISALDARRLRRGLAELEEGDPVRASRIRKRVAGDATESDDDPCPVLDPETGFCDLYEFRPLTCRLFGPPVSDGEGAVGVCELCFQGASDEEIAACAVEIDTEALEEDLLREIGEIDCASVLEAFTDRR